MCENCYRAVCSPACPLRLDGYGRASCELCGEMLTEDGGYRGEDGALCAACADTLTVDDLLCLMRLSGVGELLSLLGYRAV